MSEQKLRLGINLNTAITFLGSVIISLLLWGNSKQLELIKLNQEQSKMQVEAEMSENYVSKQWFTKEHETTQAAIAKQAEAILNISDTIGELRTDTAVIKSELQKQNSGGK